MIPIIIGVTALVYFVTNAAGNPILLVRTSYLHYSPAIFDYLTKYYHLDQPVEVRYLYYLWNLLHLDFGNQLTNMRPVIAAIGPWIWTTMYLQLAALALALGVGIPVGIYSAKHQYTKSDYAVTTVTIFGYSMPTFWLGIMLIVLFGGILKVLPSFGASSGSLAPWWGGPIQDRIAHLILPMTVLAYVEAATFVRLVRGNMLEVLRQDYVLAAYASGLSDRTVTYKHALKNAITPVITVVGLSIGSALGGAPALETVFTWPGLGFYFTQAAASLDIVTVEAITVIITIMVLIANLILDLTYGVVDPRVRI
jgi:peptide/nickel transport system permease protein